MGKFINTETDKMTRNSRKLEGRYSCFQSFNFLGVDICFKLGRVHISPR